MKLAGDILIALGVVLIAQPLLAQGATVGSALPSRNGKVLTRFAEEDVADVGVEDVHPIDADEGEVEEDLVAVLEADDQTTVVGQVGLGELVCDTLDEALDYSFLRFVIISNETVVAQRTSFSEVEGSVFPDGIGRKVWMGEVIDPEPPAGSTPTTVSMAWADPCDVESYSLKLASYNADGSTSIVKTVPCSAGSAVEVCVVELAMVFNEEEEAEQAIAATPETVVESSVDPDADTSTQDLRMLAEYLSASDEEKESFHARGLRRLDGDMVVMPSGRRLQATTQIDVMILYTPEAFTERGISETQLKTSIVTSFLTSNEATSNSGVDLTFNVVRVDQLPYSQMVYNSGVGSLPELEALSDNEDVASMRDEYQADLVLLVGYFPGTCGIGWTYTGSDTFGFSLTDSNCLDNFSHTHEMGHNLGCYHHREISSTITEYSHGFRQCLDSDGFVTVMAYANGDDCPNTPRINYFSNPAVTFLGKVTGDDFNNNAKTVSENMVAVANFRTGEPTCADAGETCSSVDGCCSGLCGSAGICVLEECEGAGGSLETVGDSVCDDANNVPECDYDGGDCCTCDCGGPKCGTGDDNACTSPTWSCEVAARQVGAQSSYKYGTAFCPELELSGYGDCDIESLTCACTCVDGDNSCGSGDDSKCIDPDSSCKTDGSSTCSDGTEGVDGNGVVCCAVGCPQCGGSGCDQAGIDAGLSASDCCGGPIKASNVYCDDTNTAPCIIGSAPEPGMCSDGTEGVDGNGVVCCSLGCPQCGGSGCDQAGISAGLSASDCCGGPIKASNIYCDDTNTAPCIIGSAPEPGMCSDGTEGIDGNGVVCCSLGCGQCGGSDCSSAGAAAGLGASDCCGGIIKASNVYCDDTNTAPCIIGSAP